MNKDYCIESYFKIYWWEVFLKTSKNYKKIYFDTSFEKVFNYLKDIKNFQSLFAFK